jgi:hypothetical protein
MEDLKGKEIDYFAYFFNHGFAHILEDVFVNLPTLTIMHCLKVSKGKQTL